MELIRYHYQHRRRDNNQAGQVFSISSYSVQNQTFSNLPSCQKRFQPTTYGPMRGWIHMEKDSLEESKGLAHLPASSYDSFQGYSPRNSKREEGEGREKKKTNTKHKKAPLATQEWKRRHTHGRSSILFLTCHALVPVSEAFLAISPNSETSVSDLEIVRSTRRLICDAPMRDRMMVGISACTEWTDRHEERHLSFFLYFFFLLLGESWFARRAL